MLKTVKEIGYHSVIVSVHKEYYPKFGFKPAYEVPDEVFIALESTENSLENMQGIVH